MSDQPSSEKHKPPTSNLIVGTLLFGVSMYLFINGVHNIITKDGFFFTKRGLEHVTGEAAVCAGIYQIAVGALLLGGAFVNIFGSSSDSSSEKSQPSSTKTKSDRRDIGAKQNDEE